MRYCLRIHKINLESGSMVNLQFIRFNYILAGERLSIATVIFFSRRYSYRRHKTNHRGKRNRLKIFRILAGAAVDICCSFLYAVLHPEIRICGGHCVRNVVQDLMTPEDASRMAQALYDAADPVCR